MLQLHSDFKYTQTQMVCQISFSVEKYITSSILSARSELRYYILELSDVGNCDSLEACRGRNLRF